MLARLYAETMRILQLPDVRKRLNALRGEPGALTSDQFGAMNRADFDRFGRLVREAGIRME